MKADDIFEVVKKYMIEEFEIPEENIKIDANLFEDLELDSIDALDMIGMLETEVDVEIDADELKKILTIKDVVDFIVAKLSEKEK
ncbi:MAG: acyl carrier protein [Spirochaetota bacterium]|nr:acyl carrier protein [Spirochaetota bacterium]